MIHQESHDIRQNAAITDKAAAEGTSMAAEAEVLVTKLRLSNITSVGVISKSRISGFGLVHMVKELLPYAQVQIVLPSDLEAALAAQKNMIYLIDVMGSSEQLADIVAMARIFPCLLVCRDDQLDSMVNFLKMGALGVIDDQSEGETFYEALLAISRGNLWVPEKYHWRFLQVCLLGETVRFKDVRLTKTQKKIARLLAHGFEIDEIVRKLDTTKPSVTTYVSKMRTMFDVGLGSDINRFFAANPHFYE
jgi:DNA-binding NarL/FixJ family response regulator